VRSIEDGQDEFLTIGEKFHLNRTEMSFVEEALLLGVHLYFDPSFEIQKAFRVSLEVSLQFY